MSAGTITLTNGSTAVTGVGTTFTTDLSVGDIVTATVGGTFYTLYVAARASNTALTLSDPFPGATTSGLSWVAVPQATLNRVAASMVTQTALAVRRILQENANWQAFYQGAGDITVTLDDGTPNGRQITGPSWAKIKADGGSAWIDRGRIPDGANINTWDPATTEGTWHISGSATVTVANGFPPGAQRGVLTVVAGGYNSGTRIFVDQVAGQWVQVLTAAWNGTSGPWSAWASTATKSLRSTDLAAGFDLNTINGPDAYGAYRIAGTVGSGSTVALNRVPYDGFLGTVRVEQGYSGAANSQQTATSNYGLVFTRYVNGTWNGTDGPWSAWVNTGWQAAPNFYTGNADDLLDDGDYPTSSATTGLPDPALWGASTPANNGRLSVRTLRSNTSVTQEFTLYSSTVAMNGRKWHREKYSTNVWTPWVENIDEKSLSRLYGIGGSTNSTLTAFDWQQFDFVTGVSYLFSTAVMTNAPADLTYNSGTGIYVRVVGAASSGSRVSLEVIPDTASTANYSVYEVLCVGAKGARVFTVRRVFTSADVGTAAGTVAAGNDTRIVNAVQPGSVPTFASMELSAAYPFIDFHFGSSAADFTSRLIANAVGNITLLGNTSGSGRLLIDGGYQRKRGLTGVSSNNAYNFYWASSAMEAWIDSTQVGTVQLAAVSDAQLKKNIAYKSRMGSLDEVCSWKPATFNMKARGLLPESREMLGFIANDVVEVSPECVTGDGLKDDWDEENPESPYTLDPTAMLAKAVLAIQELKIEVDSLKAALASACPQSADDSDEVETDQPSTPAGEENQSDTQP